MANENNTTDTRLTELEVEFRSMSKQISEIAGDMKKVLDLTSKLTLLDERQARHSTDIDRAFNEIRNVRAEVDNKVASLDRKIEANEKQVDTLRSESESWINKGKGAWFTASFLWAGIQIVVLAVAGFIWSDYKEMRKEFTALSYEYKNHVDQHKREVK